MFAFSLAQDGGEAPRSHIWLNDCKSVVACRRSKRKLLHGCIKIHFGTCRPKKGHSADWQFTITHDP